MKVTTDTITDDQVRELTFSEVDHLVAAAAMCKTQTQFEFLRSMARLRCAEIWNARLGETND